MEQRQRDRVMQHVPRRRRSTCSSPPTSPRAASTSSTCRTSSTTTCRRRRGVRAPDRPHRPRRAARAPRSRSPSRASTGCCAPSRASPSRRSTSRTVPTVADLRARRLDVTQGLDPRADPRRRPRRCARGRGVAGAGVRHRRHRGGRGEAGARAPRPATRRSARFPPWSPTSVPRSVASAPTARSGVRRANRERRSGSRRVRSSARRDRARQRRERRRSHRGGRPALCRRRTGGGHPARRSGRRDHRRSRHQFRASWARFEIADRFSLVEVPESRAERDHRRAAGDDDPRPQGPGQARSRHVTIGRNRRGRERRETDHPRIARITQIAARPDYQDMRAHAERRRPAARRSRARVKGGRRDDARPVIECLVCTPAAFHTVRPLRGRRRTCRELIRVIL